MPSRIVRQPNGLLGRFSTIVDDFTHINLTRDEAIELCCEEMGHQDAVDKVDRGIRDESVWGNEKADPDLLLRWNDAIGTVLAVHGKKRFFVRRRECTDPPKHRGSPPATPDSGDVPDGSTGDLEHERGETPKPA